MIETLMLYFILFPTILLLLLIFLTISFYRYKFHKLRHRHRHKEIKSSNTQDAGICWTSTTIAFFHPHCSGGGGGERVLWKAIESISNLNVELRGEADHDDDHDNGKEKREGCKKSSSSSSCSGKKKEKKLLHVVVYTSDSKSDEYQRGMFVHAFHLVFLYDDIGKNSFVMMPHFLFPINQSNKHLLHFLCP